MQPGNMFNENCKGCLLDEATKWDKKCPYLTQVMNDDTPCYCCEDHMDVCQLAVENKEWQALLLLLKVG